MPESLIAASVALTLITVLALALPVIIAGCSKKPDKPDASVETRQLSIGDKVVLNKAKPNPRWKVKLTPINVIASDPEMFRIALKAHLANDSKQTDALIQADKMFPILNGESVEILELGPGESRVRVLDGFNVGSEGWIGNEFL